MERIWFDDRIAWSRVLRLAAVWAAVAAVVVFVAQGASGGSSDGAAGAARPPAGPPAALAAATPTAQAKMKTPAMPATAPGPSCQKWLGDRAATQVDFHARLDLVDATPARRVILASMSRSATEWHRAAASLLSAETRVAELAACAASACDDARRRQWLDRLDAVARMASSTSNPRLYALAFNACNKDALRQHGACQLLTPDQWARLDPGNAAPWLFKAEEAGRSGDPQGVATALHRIGQAERNDGGLSLMADAVMAHASGEDDMLVASTQLAVEAIGIDAATAIAKPGALLAHCSATATADINRRQLCNEAAEVLLGKARSAADQLGGMTLVRRMGWPNEKLEALRAEQAALAGALWMVAPIGDETASCGGLRQFIAGRKTIAELGELAAARRAAQASGKTMPELAREHGRHLDRFTEKARPRAAAASSAG